MHELNQICNKKARLSHCTMILKLFPYKFPTDEDKEALFKKAKSTVSVDANPKYTSQIYF